MFKSHCFLNSIKSLPDIRGTYLVGKPFLVAPAFEVQRSVGNFFAQYMYRMKIEQNYTKEGLIRGCNKAIISSANCILNQKWDAYQNVATQELIGDLKEELDAKTETQRNNLQFILNQALDEDNLTQTILVSSLFTGDNIFKLEEKSKVSFHTAFVSYISNAKDKKNPLYCNIGLSRTVSPLGKWKITGINFFDNDFALNNSF